MHLYVLFDGRTVDAHSTDRLVRAIAVHPWNPVVMAANDCTEEAIKEQCRIVVLARELDLDL